jgi:hypothetical protein
MDTMDVVETIAANAMKHAVSIPKISIKNWFVCIKFRSLVITILKDFKKND